MTNDIDLRRRIDAILREYAKGCSVSIAGMPADCDECHNAAISAIMLAFNAVPRS